MGSLENIELRDSDNVVRVRIGIDSCNCPFLSMNDGAGRERIMLSLGEDGNGSLEFRTQKGQPTVSLGLSSLSMGMMILDVSNESYIQIKVEDGNAGVVIETNGKIKSWP